MKIILLMLLTAMLRISGCISEPMRPTSFSINVSNAKFIQERKFSADVKFTNHLGKEVKIFRLGCLCDEGTFTPSFLMEQSVGGRWEPFGGPGCIAVYVGETYLNTESNCSTVACMLWDTRPSGTFRLVFDIRYVDSGLSLPQRYLVSNSFTLP